MMKQIVFFILLLTVNVSFCQNHQPKYYQESSGKGFVCISDDSLSFRLPGGEYFYGTYTTEDSLIVLGDNLLDDRNFWIGKESCNPDVLEITCCYLERQWYMGYAGENPDTNIYMNRVDNTLHRLVLFFDDDKYFKASINGVVSLDSIDLQSFGDTLSLYMFIEGTHVFTKITLPTRLGRRYSFYQKQYEMVPFLNKKMKLYSYEYMIFFKKETGQIIFNFGDNLKEFIFKFVFTPADKNTSCIQELKRYYPDL